MGVGVCRLAGSGRAYSLGEGGLWRMLLGVGLGARVCTWGVVLGRGLAVVLLGGGWVLGGWYSPGGVDVLGL